jgi:hypothetical protein
LQAEREHIRVREGGFGAVGGDGSAGDQLLVTRGSQRDHTHDAAGEGHGAQHALHLGGGAGRHVCRDDEEDAPHDEDADDHEGVLGEEQAKHSHQQQPEEAAEDRAEREAAVPGGQVEQGRAGGQEEDELAGRKPELAAHAEGEQLQRDGQETQRYPDHRLPEDHRDHGRGGEDGEGGKRSHGIGHVRPDEREQRHAEDGAKQANWAGEGHDRQALERIKTFPENAHPDVL